MAVAATYPQPTDCAHHHEHGWSQQPQLTTTDTAPTSKSHRKQTSAPSSSTHGFLNSRDEVPHARAKSFVDFPTTTDDCNGIDTGFIVANVDDLKDSPNQKVEDNSKDPPGVEKLTRCETAVMPDVSSTPALWAPMSMSTAPEPVSTPKSNLSDHVSAPIETASGETAMQHPQISFKSLSLKDYPHVGLERVESPSPTTVDIPWGQIRRLRVDNSSLRSEIHGMRARLREIQNAKSISEDTLFQRLLAKELLEQDAQPKSSETASRTIIQMLEDCQKVRDDYGQLEFEINKLEDRLSGQEFRLTRMEDEFYDCVEDSSNFDAKANTDFSNKILSLGAIERVGVTLEDLVDREHHPLVDAFLSRLGDFDLLREQFNDLMNERAEIEEEKATRSVTGRVLGLDEQEFLDNYEKMEDEMTKKLEDLGREVEQKRKECLAKGLINENDDPTNFQIQEQATFSDEEDLNPEDNISEYVKYPLLLSRSGITQEEERSLQSEPDEESDNASKRVNEWLLQRLRTSVLDVRLLASTFEAWVGKTIDGWEVLVLNVWFKDDTTKRAGYRAYSSSLSTHSRHRSGSSSVYRF